MFADSFESVSSILLMISKLSVLITIPKDNRTDSTDQSIELRRVIQKSLLAKLSSLRDSTWHTKKDRYCWTFRLKNLKFAQSIYTRIILFAYFFIHVDNSCHIHIYLCVNLPQIQSYKFFVLIMTQCSYLIFFEIRTKLWLRKLFLRCVFKIYFSI